MKLFKINRKEKKTMNELVMKFESYDFNLLYDTLWKMRFMASWEAREGKNKQIRSNARERERVVEVIIDDMERIEERKRKQETA